MLSSSKNQVDFWTNYIPIYFLLNSTLKLTVIQLTKSLRNQKLIIIIMTQKQNGQNSKENLNQNEPRKTRLSQWVRQNSGFRRFVILIQIGGEGVGVLNVLHSNGVYRRMRFKSNFCKQLIR